MDTDLSKCIQTGDYKTFLRLLDEGVNANTWNNEAETPLIVAAAAGGTEFVEALLRHDADPSQTDNCGITPLHHAALVGNPAIVRLLLNKGVAVDPRDLVAGWTPLHLACREGRRYIVRLLLAHGADAQALDRNGETPADFAKGRGDERVLTILRAPPKEFQLDANADTAGTNLQTNFELIPGLMVEIFGLPEPGVPGKSTGSYTFRNEEGDVFTVYDWKAALSPEDFWFEEFEECTVNIGGRSDASEFVGWLLSVFEDHLATD